MIKLNQLSSETKITTYELAEFLGVTRKTLYNWEEKQNFPIWALQKLGYDISKK